MMKGSVSGPLAHKGGFKSTIKLVRDILAFLNKYKTPGQCGFPLTNPQKGSSLGFVPQSNLLNCLKLYYIFSGKAQSDRPFFCKSKYSLGGLSLFVTL